MLQSPIEERELTEEEKSQLHAEYKNVPESTNVDYRECLALINQLDVPFTRLSRTTLEILGASFEYLSQEPGKRVSPAEVLALLSPPWREVLTTLLTYPPAARQLLYTRIMAGEWAKPYAQGGWGETPEFGLHARKSFEYVIELLQQVVAWPAQQAEQQRVEQAAALQREQGMANARRADEEYAQWMSDVSRGIKQGRLNSLVAQGALLALGVAIGWIARRKDAD